MSEEDGAGRRMVAGFTLEGPSRRIAFVGFGIVVLLAVASGVTVWRYGAAGSKYREALRKTQTIALVERANDNLLDSLSVVSALAAGARRGQLPVLTRLQSSFDATIGQAALIAPSAGKRALVERIQAASHAMFRQAENGVLPAVGTARLDPAVRTYEVLLQKLGGSLDKLTAAGRTAAARAEAVAATTARAARNIAILAAAAAALLTVLLLAYVVRLVGRLFDRIRSTAQRLTGAATEMRASAAESASATNQQSAAIAQAASTIEELNATAGVIADNARAGTAAVERTGDTMRDMQEQVEAISQRSLTLGERSQKIGEVLGLINDFAEQTNLLALNAAIEAARAGDAGRGFAVVASEVRKLAERSIRSTESIREIITAVQDETNATIMATEQGAKQARGVGELMRSTADVLDESIRATDQQKDAASQVAEAMVEIRTAAEQLAAEQQARASGAVNVEQLVESLEKVLEQYGMAGSNSHRTEHRQNGHKTRDVAR